MRLVVGFDLDMTLVDSRPGIRETLRVLEDGTGAPVATEEMLDALLRSNLDLEFGEPPRLRHHGTLQAADKLIVLANASRQAVTQSGNVTAHHRESLVKIAAEYRISPRTLVVVQLIVRPTLR